MSNWLTYDISAKADTIQAGQLSAHQIYAWLQSYTSPSTPYASPYGDHGVSRELWVGPSTDGGSVVGGDNTPHDEWWHLLGFKINSFNGDGAAWPGGYGGVLFNWHSVAGTPGCDPIPNMPTGGVQGAVDGVSPIHINWFGAGSTDASGHLLPEFMVNLVGQSDFRNTAEGVQGQVGTYLGTDPYGRSNIFAMPRPTYDAWHWLVMRIVFGRTNPGATARVGTVQVWIDGADQKILDITNVNTVRYGYSRWTGAPAVQYVVSLWPGIYRAAQYAPNGVDFFSPYNAMELSVVAPRLGRGAQGPGLAEALADTPTHTAGSDDHSVYAGAPYTNHGDSTIALAASQKQYSDFVLPPSLGGSAPSAPANSSVPTISGTATEGQTLTAGNGSWTNTPTSYGYQWQRSTPGSSPTVLAPGTHDLSTITGDIVLQAGTHHIGYFRPKVGQRLFAAAAGVTVYGTYETRPGDSGCLVEGYGDSGRIHWIYENDLGGGSYRPAVAQLGGPDTTCRYVDFDAANTNNVQGLQLLTGWAGLLEFFSVKNTGTGTLLGGPDKVHGIYAQRATGIVRDFLVDTVADGYGMQVYNGSDTGAVSITALRGTLNNCKGGLIVWQYDTGDCHDNSLTKLLIASVGANGALVDNMGLSGPGTDSHNNVIDYVTSATGGYGPAAGPSPYVPSVLGYSDIVGATGQTYALVSADVGTTVIVQVVASNAAGSSAPASSAATAVIAPKASQSAPSGGFGYPTIGAQSGSMSGDRKRGSRFTADANRTITELRAYIGGIANNGVAQQLAAAIYAISGGNPGALLATSYPVAATVAGDAAPGWVSFILQAPLNVTAGTDYALVIHSGPGSNVLAIFYDTAAGTSYSALDTFTDGPADPFGTPTIDSSRTYSIYAIGAVTGQPPSFGGTPGIAGGRVVGLPGGRIVGGSGRKVGVH